MTRNTFDDLGRTVLVEKRIGSSLLNGGAMSAYKTVAEMQYDGLGQLKKKSLGHKKDISGSYSDAFLEEEDYQYNIRGWLLRVNRDYSKSTGSAERYFGFDLGYDKEEVKPSGSAAIGAYATLQYNGNIAGTVWKSRGDGEIRRYDFAYDAANRLTGALFNQHADDTSWSNANVNFSVEGLSYDANGNLKSMRQWGLTVSGSAVIDDFSYAYKNGEVSNKLLAITESTAIGNSDHKLGDFTDKSQGGDDYDYDVNGNLVLDKNKNIASITYNHLNLPELITVKTDDGTAVKGTITYSYDAAGGKLKKVVAEPVRRPKPRCI